MIKRAQASFDMLLTFMIGISIIVATIVYVNSAQTEYLSSYKINAAQNTVNKIAEAADTIFLQGTRSKIVMTLYFPDGISSDSSTQSGNTVMLKLTTSSGKTDIYQTTKEPVVGNLPTSSGTYKITVENIGDSVSIGY
jgi:uncharacterized protein (UPF0333 family)